MNLRWEWYVVVIGWAMLLVGWLIMIRASRSRRSDPVATLPHPSPDVMEWRLRVFNTGYVELAKTENFRASQRRGLETPMSVRPGDTVKLELDIDLNDKPALRVFLTARTEVVGRCTVRLP